MEHQIREVLESFFSAHAQADSLTTKGVIFVPIQYRLGTLGILSDGTAEFSGNAALFDMAAAIRWVYDYIQFFGGDSKQITVIGHGSGATAATYLTTSKVPRSMITGIVAMSGTPYTQYTLDEKPHQSVQEIAEINSCPKTNETEIVNCLRKVSPFSLHKLPAMHSKSRRHLSYLVFCAEKIR